MPIRIPNKNEKFPEPEPSSNPTSDFNPVSTFTNLTAKLRWERENIEPELGGLSPYYRHRCYIFLTPHCHEEYVGEGYGVYSENSADKYEKIGTILAKMWPIEEVTEVRKMDYYSRGCG
ncbi:hypothetical protein QUB05_07350 [Microcoleus sp. F10-C6]|uniref:hypothetical protein n=1 Tax=unclassified Microcoleus TaxID=2642155 RepID=UPI002FD6A484